MKRKFKHSTTFIFIFLYLFFLIKDNIVIVNNIVNTTNLFFNKVFPSLFPLIIVNDILISYNLPYYICKLLKTNNISLYVFIMSLISGTPSNAVIISKLVDNKTINNDYASKLLSFTYFSSPLFLITMLYSIFNNYSIVTKIILIHYISNIIIYFIFYKKYNNNIKYIVNDKTLSSNILCAIKNSINTMLIIFATIIFFAIISTMITNIININPLINALINGIFEITRGLNSINILNISVKLKEIISLIIISFGGLSIHMQVLSIINDYKIKYKYFFIGRILQVIISIILIIIF